MKLLSKKYEHKSKDKTSKSKDDECNYSQCETVIPTTDSALRNIYMVGYSSIWNNLPRPKMCMIDEHSYTSIRQCIVQFFASGKIPQNVSNDEVHWMEEFDKEDEASLKSESQSLIKAAFKFYDNEIESLE